MSSSSSSATPATTTATAAAAAPVTLQCTPVKDIPGIVQQARDFFDSDATKPLDWRKQQLRALYNMVKENEEALKQAERSDLGCSTFHSYMATISMIYNDLSDAITNLDSWAAPEFPSVGLVNKFDKCQIRSGLLLLLFFLCIYLLYYLFNYYSFVLFLFLLTNFRR